MGLACEQATKAAGQSLIIPQGFNEETKKLEVVTTANQDPLICAAQNLYLEPFMYSDILSSHPYPRSGYLGARKLFTFSFVHFSTPR